MHFLRRDNFSGKRSALDQVKLLPQSVDPQYSPSTGALHGLNINTRIIPHESIYLAHILKYGGFR